MALLGLISLLQIWFIPGYLALYRGRDISQLDKILLAIPLSATINFFLIYALVWIHAYTQTVVIAIFSVEIIALLFIAQNKSKPRAVRSPQTIPSIDFNFTNIVFALVLLLHVCQVLNQIGTVFIQGDVISSWNPWARSWFNGAIPHKIGWYPQLLPILYSITYQFMAESQIELFAKIMVSFYPIVTFAIVIRMAFLIPAERKKILWSGIIFFLLVRRLWGGESTVNGYADFPLAFCCISIIYVFVLKFFEQSRQVTLHSNTLAFVLVGVTVGAGLMKQSGIYLGMLAPFFWLAYFRNGKDLSTHVKQSALLGISIALALSTWYFYQLWRISTGMELSYLQNLASVIPLPWYQSIAYGFKGITYKLSWLWVVLFLASLMHHRVRYIALFVVLPLFLLWAAFVPYDYRNLAVIFPVLAITLSYGWAELAHSAGKFLPARINSPMISRSIVLLILATLAFALSDPKYNNELLKLSDEAKSQIGDPEINSRLSAYFEFHPDASKVATSYQEMGKIPGLSERYWGLSCVYGKQLSIKESVLTELSNPAIHYVLLQPWCDARVLDFFSSQSDKYHMVFQRNGAVFYEIVERYKP